MPSNTHLDKLKAQRQKIEARIQALEARNKSAARKQDLQRKILVGAYYLQEALKNDQMNEMKTKMDGFLKRDSDRRLFDLPPLQQDK